MLGRTAARWDRLAMLAGGGTMTKAVMRVLFGAAFVAIGVLHFIRPAPFTSIVPPYLPFPLALVYISGAAEIALGVLLQFARTRRLAASGLIVLLIAVFPANLHMWLHPEQFPGLSPTALLIRLPLQLLLIAVVYWVGLSAHPDRAAA